MSNLNDKMSTSDEKQEKNHFTDDEYFSSYQDLEIHRLMVGDVPRTTAYRNAILENKHLFRGKTVMDVGAGTGILSLFAAAAGARRVFAVEASGTAALVEKVAADNGYAEIISVLHARVEDVQLDEKVDVIISEWMGFYLLHESMLNSVLYARDSFLSEEGTVFPSEARIYACPCSTEELFHDQIRYWDDVHGFNMSAVGSCAMAAKATKPEVCTVKPKDLLADPVCIKTISLRWMDVEEITNFSENTFVSITNNGSYHGICMWFECDFDGRDYDKDGQEFGKLVTLSTSPSEPATHWKQTVVMLGEAGLLDDITTENSQVESGPEKESKLEVTKAGNSENDVVTAKKIKLEENVRKYSGSCALPKKKYIELEKDEVIGWSLEFVQSVDNTRQYSITVQMLDPETDEHPEPCCCSMPRCLIIAKIINDELDGKSFLQPTDK